MTKEGYFQAQISTLRCSPHSAAVTLWTLTALCWVYIGFTYSSMLTKFWEMPRMAIRRNITHRVTPRKVIYHMMRSHLKNQVTLMEHIKGSDSDFIALDDPDLLWYIGAHLVGPSTGPHKDKWTGAKVDFSEVGQAEFIDDILQRKQEGCFLEAGTGSGTYLSNTLYFEKKRAWTGLLIEPLQKQYKSMLSFGRHAVTLNACLSSDNKTQYKALYQNDYKSRIIDNWPPKIMHAKLVQVECFPLYSILLAAGISHIDFFALDVCGGELDILKTLPLGAVTINAFTVSFRSDSGLKSKTEHRKNLEGIKEFFANTGIYEYLGVLPNGTTEHHGSDAVFKRKNLIL